MIVPFEGLYIETDGQQSMCILGTSVSPFLEGYYDPLELPMAYSSEDYSQPPLLRDDRVMLVLQYPHTFSLAGRVIRGEMRNLNQNSNPKYFDKVYISSSWVITQITNLFMTSSSPRLAIRTHAKMVY